MSKSKAKTCMIPTCNKEVFTPKALFCGEHDRDFRDYRKNAGIATGALASTILAFVAKRVIRKKIDND